MQQSYRQTNPFLHYGILAFILVIGVLTLSTHTVLHATPEPHHAHAPATTDAHKEDHCHGPAKQSHVVTFTEIGVTPAQIIAQRCDEVIVKNQRGVEMIPALGPHSDHIHYNGFEETMVQPQSAYAFRATTAGTYPLHDHDDPDLSATLIVR